MSIALAGRRPAFARLFASARHAVRQCLHSFGALGSRPATTPCDSPAGGNFDPSRLSRPELLAELLSAVSAFAADDTWQVADCGIHAGYGSGTAAEAAAARKLAAARELLLRDLRIRMGNGPVLDEPAVVKEWLQLHCAGLDHEVFLVLYLDDPLRLIHVEQLFRGTLTQCAVYPREVVKGALAHRAAAVVFAHNHPSGSTEPSCADQLLTTRLTTALSCIDVQVLDHFIVTGEQVFSFAEKGLI